MILVFGQTEAANILHMIAGPETDTLIALHGAAAIDITPALSQMSENKRVVIHMTRCVSEAKVVADLQGITAAGAAYPFIPPIVIFGPKQVMDNIHKGSGVVESEDAPGEKKSEPTAIRGKCSHCSNPNVELVPKIRPAICISCAEIEINTSKLQRKPVKQHKATVVGGPVLGPGSKLPHAAK